MIMDIHSWDEWFELCGEAYENVGQYENTAVAVIKKFIFDRDEHVVDKELSKYRRENLTRDFYKKLGVGKALPYLLRRRLPVLFIGMPVCGIIWLIAQLATKAEIRIGAHENKISAALVLGALSAIVLYLLVWGISILSFWLSYRSLLGKLKKQESIAEDQIKFVPPKYRNSFCMEQIYKLWQDYSDMTFSDACDSIDAHIRKYGVKTPFKAVLFDIPYEKTEYTGSVPDKPRAYESDDDDKEQENDPALPADISTKAFAGSDDAEAELDELVGMDSVKEQIKRMKNRISFYGGSNAGGGSHIAFLGNPGTGKTVTARIVTKILYDFGYIKKNKCVEIDGDYLKSPYAGQTGERTAAIVRYAMGGVLFIDEAYLLYDKNSATAGEAVGVLLKAMEDNRKDFVVIFAGYPEQMNRLLNMNEGFASRIKYRIYFDDYTVDELWDIFMLFVDKYTQGVAYSVSDLVKRMICDQFEAEKGMPHFGNARFARNAVDAIMDYHADNCISGVNSKPEQNTITEEDVKAWLGDRIIENANNTRNFVGASDMDTGIITTAELRQHDRTGTVDADKALKYFVGLTAVKSEIEDIKKQCEFYGKGLNVGHMAFRGAEGTGKTSMVQVVTGFLYEHGCIRDNRYVSVTGDFLRGIYVGQTGRRVQAVVQYARGAVLFIDEIGALCNRNADDSFGVEALTVLQQAMGERDDITVIIAGTDKEIDYLYKVNPGFSGLIRRELKFSAPTARELCVMFKRVATANKFTVDEAIWNDMQKFWSERAGKPGFGNAREVHKLFDMSKQIHINNYTGDESKKFVISRADILTAMRKYDL